MQQQWFPESVVILCFLELFGSVGQHNNYQSLHETALFTSCSFFSSLPVVAQLFPFSFIQDPTSLIQVMTYISAMCEVQVLNSSLISC